MFVYTTADLAIIKCTYNEKELVKAIGDFKFNKSDSTWIFPLYKLVDIVDNLHIDYSPQTKVVYDQLREEKQKYHEKINLANKIKSNTCLVNKLDGIDLSVCYQHQKKAITLAAMFDNYALFMETGTGKTLVALKLIEYWKMPAMIVAPLSTLESVWAKEIIKWSKLNYTILWHNLNDIDKEYNIYLINYEHFKLLSNTSQELIQEKIGCLVIDECLNYHQKILLEDGSIEKIGTIVDKGINKKVLSWNFKKGIIEPKPILNYFRKIRHNELVSIFPKGFKHSSIKCTLEHKISTPIGMIRARSLKVGDLINVQGKILSQFQKEALLGILLGDGSIGNIRDSFRHNLKFCHGYKQKKYLEFKRNIFKSFQASTIKGYSNPNQFGKLVYQFCVSGINDLYKITNITYPKGKKKLTKEWIEQVTPISLAYWFLDDGTFYSKRLLCSLCTNSFDPKMIKVLITYLKDKFNINFKLYITSKGPVINLTKHSETLKFLKLISPYIPNCMKYKTCMPNGEKIPKEFNSDNGLIGTEVSYINKFIPKSPDGKYVFDLEIKDNHNYILPGGFIVSNSSKLKNPKSGITKEVLKYKNIIKHRLCLTGTPIPNSLLEYFGQMCFINSTLLGENYYRYRNTFFFSAGYGGYIYKPMQGAKEAIIERVSRQAFSIRKEDCLDLPDRVYETRYVYMDEIQGKAYEMMKKENILEFKDSITLAANELAKIMKLRQVTSGFTINTKGIPVLISDTKIKALKDLLEEIPEDKQVIIWLNFHFEIERLKDEFKDSACTLYGEMPQKAKQQSIEDFQNGKYRLLLAHPLSGGLGLTFVNCSYVIWYSLNYSQEQYSQANDRVYRIGQKNKVTYFLLMAKDTIDEIIYKALNKKANLMGSCLEMLKGKI